MNRYIYAIVDKKTSFCFVDTREYDLQQKIDLEIKMREGTSKLLAACKHTNQCLEAAKSLLTSDARLSVFRSELQKRKPIQRTKSKKNLASKAKASVSEIRIPLIWKDTDYFKNKGDYRRFAVFCLLQIGTEIYDTIMVNVDRNVTDICFDDSFHFNDILPDFQFKLSVYARVLHDDLSIASTHKKLTHKISNSFSRSLGRKLNSLKDDFDPESGPKFNLIASASLNLTDASDSIKTYDLVVDESIDKSLQLPLFGHYCCRLAVQPECQVREYISGIVQFRHTSTLDYGLFWASLKSFKLLLWNVNDELKGEPVYLKHTLSNKTPDLVIAITAKSKISHSESVTIANPDNTFSLLSYTGQHHDWLKHLACAREDFIAWEPIAEYQMELASTTHHRSQYLLQDRLPGSLYSETPIQEHELKKRHSKSLSNFSFNDKANYNLRSSKMTN